MSIGGRHANGRSQYVDAPTLHLFVEAGRESLMPIMKEKLAIAIARKRFSELLQGPLSRRMRGHVEVDQTPRPNRESDENIKDTETCRDCDKEVAGDNLMRMIAEKGCPALILRPTPSRQPPHVLANGTWGEPNLQFQQEFIRDPLFTPGRVFGRHAANQSPQFDRNWRSSNRSRLPTPKPAERRPMPANKRGWIHDDQSLAPVKQASEARKNEPVRYICGFGLLLMF